MSGPRRGRSGRLARPPLITLLSDFGLADAYVAAMKGVIARICPGAVVVDVSHGIPPQDIRRGGIVWASAVPYFPDGTIHVGVVDPGVGTRRRIIVVEALGAVFLAPDNGILGYVIPREEIRRCVQVTSQRLFLEPVSATFHGRDVFAPVAAHLALGLRLDALGPDCEPERWETISRPRARLFSKGRSRYLEETGEVVDIDAFGNAATNLRPREGAALVVLRTGRLALRRLHRAYAGVAGGRPVLLVGSMGNLEVAVNLGSARARLGLKRGSRVVATWRLES